MAISFTIKSVPSAITITMSLMEKCFSRLRQSDKKRAMSEIRQEMKGIDDNDETMEKQKKVARH